MPELRPFRGFRYADDGAAADLVCPPYDVISPEEQAELYERHPHNAVRLELARPEGGADAYAQAAELFSSWAGEGVLEREPQPALYVYRQDFTPPGGERHSVTGVLGALRLEPFGSDAGVLPHERTMEGPKADRLALMRATRLNVSPIYAIHRGGGAIAPFLGSLENRPPQVQFTDGAGTRHRLWVITAPAEVEMLSDAHATGPLVIADGHHRYETALAFHREMAHAGEEGEHGAIMCFCVDADSEGLFVMPYHRAVRGTPPEELRRRLRDGFACERSGRNEVEAALAADAADHRFAFVFPDGAEVVTVTDDEVVAAVGADRARAWRDLDVVALHEVVLPRVTSGEPDFTFTRDPAVVDGEVTSGAVGILMRAMEASEVVDVARSGERLPQKASYFWPKAVTGLVFRQL